MTSWMEIFVRQNRKTDTVKCNMPVVFNTYINNKSIHWTSDQDSKSAGYTRQHQASPDFHQSCLKTRVQRNAWDISVCHGDIEKDFVNVRVGWPLLQPQCENIDGEFFRHETASNRTSPYPHPSGTTAGITGVQPTSDACFKQHEQLAHG